MTSPSTQARALPAQENVRPPYQPPTVESWDVDALLDLLGPARTLYTCDPADPTCP